MSMNTKKIKVNLISETVFTVQGHGVHTAFLETRDALKKIGVEVKTNSNEKCNIVHIHTVGIYSLVKLLKNRRKTIVTAHVVPNSFVGSFALAKLWLPLAKIYLRFFYNKAAAIIAVSPEVKEELKELGIKKKIYILANSVNLNKFKKDEKTSESLRKRMGINKEDFVVLMVGQLQPRKGIEPFIDVAKKLPTIRFIWAGGIPFKWLAADYHKMKKLQKNAPKNIYFTGTAGFDEMPSYYNASDMLFFPSFQETFGFAVIEAGACRIPLLLRDLEIYKPIFNGNFIKGDEKNFKEHIIRLKEDKNFYKKYSDKAYKLAEKYENTKMARSLVKIYAEVLEGKNR